MKDKYEVLVSSDTSGALGVWDPSTGNCLHQYKGGVTRANTLTWIKQDWLLSAPPDKPLLNVWLGSKAEQAPVRMFTPAPTQALSASPSGLYLAAATAETITLYLVSTGAVVGVVTRHYQPITVLAWTADSSHWISGGEDGQVLVWSLVTAVSRRQLPGREEASLGQVTPRYTWTGHALPVTGIHVGHGPAHSARVVSASLDMTVKIYSMTTGDMLLSVSLTTPVKSIAMDNTETSVWAGDKAGDIHKICLLSPPRDVCVTSDSQGVTSLSRGHEASVTHLSVSCDGLSLASGDSSGGTHLWDTASGQIIRSLPHKSAISHLSFSLTPPALVNKESWSPGSKLVPLQKGVNKDKFECAVFRKTDILVSDTDANVEDDMEMEEDRDTSSHTVEELKQINQQLYKYSLKHILNSR